MNDAGERRETGRSPVFDMVGDVTVDVVTEGCACLAEGISAKCLLMLMLIVAAARMVPLLLR